MIEDSKYPDLITTEAPEGFKKLERVNGRSAPDIAWGFEYQSWPVEKRLAYAENLASSMNHAADLLQQERNAALGTIEHKEKQIKALYERLARETEVFNRQFQDMNESRQSLLRKIVTLEGRVGEQTKEIRSLKRGDHD